VDRHRSAIRQGQTSKDGINALLIEGMTAFVHGAEERRSTPLRVKPGGDAHIANAKGRGEGMGGFILTPAVPVIPKTGDHIHAKIPLPLFGIGAVQEGIVHLRAGCDCLDDFHLLGTQRAKDRLYIPCFETRLKIIQ